MGLFINNNEHPDVYKNKHQLETSNQMISRQDFLSELMKEHQKANAALEKALSEIGFKTQLQEETQLTHWNHVGAQLVDVRKRLERNEDTNHQLVAQMNIQLELQKEFAETMTKQKEFQAGVLQRLDTQEALIDKITRQINHIRSILFERTNYLAAKIDEGYKITSSYVYKLMTGSDQPLTFLLMKEKKEENQKQME